MTHKKNYSHLFTQKKILEIFIEYEGPKVYSFLTAENGFFIAYFCNESDDGETWLYLPTNEYQLSKFIRDEICIKDFFLVCPTVYLATRTYEGVETFVESMEPINIPSEFVPDSGICLNAPFTDLTIKIEKEGISPANVQETSIIKIVSAFHKAIKNVMKERRRNIKNLQSFGLEPRLAITGVYPGSVEVRLRTIEHNPLFSDAVTQLQMVINDQTPNQDQMENDPLQKIREVVRKELFPIFPNPNSRLFNFESISLSGTVNGISEKANVKFNLTPQIRESYAEKIKMAQADTRSIVLTGIIRELDKDYESFFLRSIDTNDLELTETKCLFDGEIVELDEIQNYFLENTQIEIAGDYALRDKILEAKRIRRV